MSTEIEKKICSKHNLEIQTIDLKESTAEENKYLCIKCLIEKIDIQNIALVEETKIMIKQMKSEQLNHKIKENQKRIENFTQIQSQLKELKLSINNIIDKVQSNIDQNLNLFEKELEESESKTLISSFEDDVKVLSKNYKGSFSFEIPKESYKYINDNSYIDSIQQQLESITKSSMFIQINQTLQKSKFEDQIQELQQVQLLTKKEDDPQKTPSLKIQCNKHGKEIIMLNLNPETTKFSRLACVECIKSNDPIKYTTLSDASFRWNEYLGQTSDQINKFQNQRSLRSQSIIEILENIKEKHNFTISEIINKINTQSQIYSNNLTNDYNENIIYEMKTEQVNELTEILSQNDMFQALTERLSIIQKEDINQQQSITANLGKLLLSDLQQTEKINQIFYEKHFDIKENMEMKKDLLKEESNLQHQNSIIQFNLQLQNFQIYQDILHEAFNQYELVIQAINNISQEFKKVQVQKFNEQLPNFDKELSLIKKITKFDQLEIQFNQQKEKLQNELHECQKINLANQQVINDFKKHDTELVLQIKDLSNQNTQLSRQQEQQKAEYEVKLKHKQEELETILQSNCRNEEMVKQLQLDKVWQFSQSLTFSTTYKHSNCSVTQNGKMVENISGSYNCCMCDQMIPKNRVIQFAIKFIELNDLLIGIGFRDIAQSKAYHMSCYIGGGTYNIDNRGFCWNHDQQDKCSKQIAFSFQKNDIIIVEVDIQKQYVKWINSSTNQTFSLTIDTSKDLYPCVHFGGKNKLEILNQVFK
ncbi:unnamed protein product [Paramecium pentaurelia]|uniref:B30.2/SPRY domain-containing protein n=1 Tax=Paramecium pentaurelia TaxID=43138 RepID=A0A8S1YJB3_9CILI|nr:unnamed protein product [Paramecium pentaurelia]